FISAKNILSNSPNAKIYKRFKMKILCVSDFHLGNGTKSDDFAYGDEIKTREKALIDFIEAQNADKIYLVGDIYELWQAKMETIRQVHSKLIKYLENNPKIEFIKGNHDYDLTGTLSVKFNTDSGKKVIITHGFQHHKHGKNWFVRFLVYMMGWVEIVINADIDKLPTILAKPGDKTKYQKEQRVFAETILQKYDILICGHTHRPLIENIDGKIYANCGTCQWGKLEGILLDTTTDEVSLITKEAK
ncbi:MAG: hypothetical protein GF364_13485, partial [Candidatus Lokiarchaeota archaeon]|nr:hypothetical protein [Candidatus Lokiarchaeota archaeon]